MNLTAWLDQLEGRGLVVVAEQELDLAYLFRHALIRDAAYASLLRRDRLRLHEQVAAVLERLHPDHIEELAYHFRAAGQSERARHYFALVGERALSIYANQEAEAAFRAGLELAPEQEQAAALRSGLARALALQGRYDDAIATWREAIALYLQLGQLDEVAQLYARCARNAWWSGDKAAGLALCREGLSATASAPAGPGLARLLHETARALHLNGQPPEAEPLCRRALLIAEQLQIAEVRAEALTTLGMVLAHGHSYDQAQSALAEAVELAEAAGLLLPAARANYTLAELLERDLGDLPAARSSYARSAELVGRRRSPTEELFVRSTLAVLMLAEGDLPAAERELALLRRLEAATPTPGLGGVQLLLVEALLLLRRGDHAAGLDALRAYLERGSGSADPLSLRQAVLYAAQILAEHGSWQVLRDLLTTYFSAPDESWASRRLTVLHSLAEEALSPSSQP